MRINDAYNNPHISPAPIKSSGSTEARGAGVAPSEVSGGDAHDSVRVSISTRARELASVSGNFDAAKVARLKAAVDKGEFKVDPQAVANGIVNESAS